ncbi:hypothetical protein, partial [Sutterella wadsworthensis]
ETDKRVKHEKQFLIEVFLSLKMLGRRTLIGNHPTQRKPLRGECGSKGRFCTEFFGLCPYSRRTSKVFYRHY